MLMMGGPGSLNSQALAPPMGRAWLRRHLPPEAALPLLLMLIVVATVAGYNTPRTLRVAPGDETRQLFFGFHGLEQTDDGPFRWTDGLSRICLEQTGRLVSAALSVRLLGEGAHAIGRTTVTFLVNDRAIVEVPIQGVTRQYHMHLGDALATHDDDCVTIASAASPVPGDVRTLGVPFGGLTLRPLDPAGQLNVPALLQLALNLLLALTLYWLLTQGGVSPWTAAIGVGVGAVLLLLAVLSQLSLPGLGLARHMVPLVLGLAAIGAAGAALRRTRNWQPLHQLLVRDLLGMAFWSLMLVALTEILQQLLAFGGVWPLKAGFFPNITPLVIIPVAGFAVWAWVLLHTLGGGVRVEAGRSALLLLLGAATLSVSLKAVVRGWETLFSTFTDNPFEYIADVPRVGNDPIGFLRTFVQVMDDLALHSSTHPPGSILLLWAVERTLGPGPVPASWVAIGLSTTAVLAALWAGRGLGGPRLGLLAGAIAAVMPGQLVFSTTSMDGLFNALLALGAVAFLLAMERPFRPGAAALAGLLIAGGLFFTYATTQLAFFGLAVGGVALWREWAGTGQHGAARLWAAGRPVLRQGLIAAGMIVLIYLALGLATGFNVVEGALRATAINAEVMRGVRARPFLPPSLAYYTLYLVANLLAFGWYLGPWGLTASLSAGSTALRQRPPTSIGALAAGLAALVAGMALSGLFNREVERIWGFTYPLIAVLIANHALQGDMRTQRWRAGLFLCLAFAHGLLIRMLLSTFW